MVECAGSEDVHVERGDEPSSMAMIDQAIERVYNARLVSDPDSATISSGKVHDLFHGLDAGAESALTVQVRAATAGYQVRVGSLSGRARPPTRRVDHDRRPARMEIGWQDVSPPTGNDGPSGCAGPRARLLPQVSRAPAMIRTADTTTPAAISTVSTVRRRMTISCCRQRRWFRRGRLCVSRIGRRLS